MHRTELAIAAELTPPRRGARRTGRFALAAAVSASALALTGVTALPAAADAPGWVALPNPNPADLTGTVAPLDPTEAITLQVYLA